MDSHADTTVAGKNCAVLQYTDRSCDVSPFSDKAQLETTISELLTKKSKVEASIASIITDESSTATPMSEITGAGDSFVGRAEKVSKKGNKS